MNQFENMYHNVSKHPVKRVLYDMMENINPRCILTLHPFEF